MYRLYQFNILCDDKLSQTKHGYHGNHTIDFMYSNPGVCCNIVVINTTEHNTKFDLKSFEKYAIWTFQIVYRYTNFEFS